MTGRATLAVLATELGVSRTTVSNAFSRPDQLSTELRDRILAAAARHGYAGPDPVAHGLATGRVGVVGLLMAVPAGFAFADPAIRVILDGLVSTLSDEATGVLLAPTTPTEPQPAATLPVDGFVVLCTEAADPAVRAARRRGLPLVAIDQPRTIRLTTRIDDEGGAALAAQHLLDLGHRRVGIVALPMGRDTSGGFLDDAGVAAARHPIAAERLAGYRTVLDRAGATIAGCWEVPVNHRDEGRRAARELLAVDPRLTAVLAESDALALGVIEELHQHGLDVPGDVSVVGFDDVGEAASAPVPLTTVRQPLFDRGVEAATLITAAIAGRRPPTPAIRPLELVVRASTAPPPRR